MRRLKVVAAALLLNCPLAGAALVDLGNGLVNHPAADMTWTADGNLFRTQAAAQADLVERIISAWQGQLPFGHQLVPADFDTGTGAMTYWGALAWLHYLNVSNYKGYNDWRLADIGPPRPPGACGGACYPSSPAEITQSEWYRLFHEELGGTAGVPIATSHDADFDLFTSISGGWSSNVAGDLVNQFFADGGQGRNSMGVATVVWPVRTGVSITNPPPKGFLVLSKIELSFADQVTLTRSNAQTLAIRNQGTAAVSIASMTTTSPNQDDEFVVTHDCPALLSVDAGCTARVTFRPQLIGTTRGSLTIEADGRSYPVALVGQGTLGVNLTSGVQTTTAGEPVSLNWSTSTVDVRECTATGGLTGDGWSGAVSSTGSDQVTSAAAGAVTYTVTCTSATDSLVASSSVTVNYTVPVATLAAASTNIQQGQPNSLTWTATHASQCTAQSNGDAALWSGSRPLSGSADVVERSVGLITYTLTCTAGTRSAIATVQVFVNEPQGSSGGGGAVGVLTLLGLLTSVGRRLQRMRQSLAA